MLNTDEIKVSISLGFILIINSAISSDLKCVTMLIYETIHLLNYF